MEGGCQEAILTEGKRGEKTLVNYTKSGLKISGNRSYRLMNPDLNFWSNSLSIDNLKKLEDLNFV